MRRVVVIGSGISGTAAALTAAQRGAAVALVARGPGASALAGGALDDVPWEDAAETAESVTPLAEPARRVLDALDAYSVGERRAIVVAKTGIVRVARGVDRALLDLAAIGRGQVMVLDVEHGAWDAAALARAWSAAAPASVSEIAFVPVAASLLARTDEHAFGDADLAARHDDPSRVEWLADRLREARASARGELVGIVLPPWLGVERERASELSARVGVPCGEVLGGVGGPGGLRFERARDRALAKAGVRVVAGRIGRVAFEGGVWRVEIAGQARPDLACDAVILATGGLIGGGLEYTPAGAYFARVLPDEPRPLVRVTCEAPVRVGVRGRLLVDPSSLFGGAPETHAWPYREPGLLEEVGVLVDDDGRATGAPPGLHAAGEVAEGAPRTWLAALGRGVQAAIAASAHPETEPARSDRPA